MTPTQDNVINYIHKEINFGQVPIGSCVTKKYKLYNNSSTTINYVATRNPDINPIYYVFNLDKYELNLQRNSSGEFIVCYKPTVAWVENMDYFKIMDTQHNLHNICVRGECIGPRIQCSIKYLNFTVSKTNEDSTKVFELINTSQVPVIFHFDGNYITDPFFSISPMKGTLSADSVLKITVKFSPPNHGVFTKQICCLIMYHEPILVTLCGLCLRSEVKEKPKIQFNRCSIPIEDTVGYRGYLNDCLRYRKILPPVSLCDNFIDFGRVLVQNQCKTLTTSLTNHLNTKITIIWSEGQYFNVNPKKIMVPPSSSLLLECKFNPTEACQLYGEILNATIFWGSEELLNDRIDVPITLNIRFIGHSFPESQAWIPNVSITPQPIILPLTLPSYPSWTTFIIRSHGHLPVLFKLLPPKKTNFIMKPMVGLIRNYQIIVVQLETNIMETKSFIEIWNIELNGQLNRWLPIHVKAEMDLPSIMIGGDNTINFGNIQKGCQVFNYIPIKSTSNCHLQVHLNSENVKDLVIDPGVIKLSPCEEVFTNWFYTCNSENLEEFEVKSEIRAICNNGNIMGPPFETLIKVKAKSCHSELCAIPRCCELGEMKYGTLIKKRFYLFNFGNSTIYFILFASYDSKTKESDILIFPPSGKCGGQQKHLVEISFHPHEIGQKKLKIYYSERQSEYSNQTINSGGIELLEIEFETIFPIIQVEDIVEHNFAPLFTKAHLLEIFQVNNLNKLLAELRTGDSREINLFMPQYEPNNQQFYVVFLLRNTTSIDIVINLKRKKLCNCIPKEEKSGLSIRKKVLECPHKEMLLMECSDSIIKEYSTVLLKINIKYYLDDEEEKLEDTTKIVQSTTLCYILNLSDQRSLQINIIISCLNLKDKWNLSTYTNQNIINFGNVFIGLKEPQIQAFWFYNNTSRNLSYLIDVDNIVQLNESQQFEILKCLNCNGVIEAYSSQPILFRFCPISTKFYQVTVPVKSSNNYQLELIIEGTGIDIKPTFQILSITETLPKNPAIYLPIDCPIILSTDTIKLDPFLTWSCTERFLLIKNVTENSDIQYIWKPYNISGLIRIEIIEKEGVLRPNETHLIQVKFYSLNEPCKLNLTLTCQLIDLTQLNLYQESLKQLQEEPESSAESKLTPSSSEIFDSPKPELETPQPFNIAINVEINTIGVLDKDLLPLDYQLQQFPCKRVRIDAQEIFDNYLKIERNDEVIEKIDDTFHCILHCLARDAVSSDYFKELLKSMRKSANPVYSQIRVEPREVPQRHLDRSRKLNDILCDLDKLELQELGNLFKQIISENMYGYVN